MVSIYLADSGLMSIPYSASESRFPTYATASSEEKRGGEFYNNAPLELKVSNFTMGISNNSQKVGGVIDKRTTVQRTGTAPFQFTITAYLDKPKNTFIDIDRKDLNTLGELLKYTMSNGYKQFWIRDVTNSDRETLFSIYDLIKTFGYSDSSLAIGTTIDGNPMHLKVYLESFTQNEGVDKLSYQITFSILWDM